MKKYMGKSIGLSIAALLLGSTLLFLAFGNKSPAVAIIVHEPIYNYIYPEINNYTTLVSGDFQPLVYTWNSPSPYELRLFLRSLYENSSIVGAVLVGNVPVQKFYTYWEYYPNYSEVHLCPYYYMDLDGRWLDTDNDGVLDSREGDIDPEIFVGIIRSLRDNGNNIQELKSYFKKIELYRRGGLYLPEHALVFIDDDWYDWAPYWANDVSYAYPSYTLIREYEHTIGARYLKEISSGNYSLVHVAVHSWPGGHMFKNGSSWEYVLSYHIDNSNHKVLFYNLFACSAAKFDVDCIAQHYLINGRYTLLVIGSTKIGGMWMIVFSKPSMATLYQRLGNGECFGQAFLAWFSLPVNYDSYFDYFAGMCILGDPLLKIKNHVVAEL